MATKRILLTRMWDGHPAGEIIEEADFTVDSMVRKGYGHEITGRRAKAETTTANPIAEMADAAPVFKSPETVLAEAEQEVEPPVKRGRGRPRKVVD